jgi:hypothetical protein
VSNLEQIYPEEFAHCRAGSIFVRGVSMPVRKTSKREEYLGYAEHCLKLVRLATRRETRVIQREMAAEWFKLADMFSAARQAAE